jgi:hypothetical protein
MLGSIKIIRFA